jgi:hypothetical protein
MQLIGTKRMKDGRQYLPAGTELPTENQGILGEDGKPLVKSLKDQRIEKGLPDIILKSNLDRVNEKLKDQRIPPEFREDYEVTHGVEGGMRGQGRRSGKMVKGSMGSILPYKSKGTRLAYNKLMNQDQKEEFMDFERGFNAGQVASMQDNYLKARASGYGHHQSLNYALFNLPD